IFKMSGKRELKINTKFAQKYDKYRQKSCRNVSVYHCVPQELDPAVERDFYRILSLLKKKDPKIYEKDAKFYSEDTSHSDEKPSTSKKAAVKPMFLKDYERAVILEKEGGFSQLHPGAAGASSAPAHSLLTEVDAADKEDEDAGGEGRMGSPVCERLPVRRQTLGERRNARRTLTIQLIDYWNNTQLEEKERFLRDYVLNKGYLNEEDDDEERCVPQKSSSVSWFRRTWMTLRRRASLFWNARKTLREATTSASKSPTRNATTPGSARERNERRSRSASS
uniref:Uncharacterized protein n=1 Tax=Oryzias latipes TaxID=8090 RepID=A0A3P9LSG1_ORYLA